MSIFCKYIVTVYIMKSTLVTLNRVMEWLKFPLKLLNQIVLMMVIIVEVGVEFVQSFQSTTSIRTNNFIFSSNLYIRIFCKENTIYKIIRENWTKHRMDVVVA